MNTRVLAAIGVAGILLATGCSQDSSSGRRDAVTEPTTIVGVEFQFSNATIPLMPEPYSSAPAKEEIHPVVEFVDSDARLSSLFSIGPYRLQPPYDIAPNEVRGCASGATISFTLRSDVGDTRIPLAKREFHSEAGTSALVSVAFRAVSSAGVTVPSPQHVSVGLTWYPAPREMASFDYLSADAADYAATVPTVEELRTLTVDLFRSLVAAVGDEGECEPGTELSEQEVVAHFDRFLADVEASREVAGETAMVGVPVDGPSIDVDAVAGFVFTADGERHTESVIVTGDRTFASMPAQDVAALEQRLMSITEHGTELVTDEDWTEAESSAYSPNYVSVSVTGDDLVIVVDTKGTMTDEMRGALIAVISHATAASGAQTIQITDVE